ncbi:MAG: hypothetical protein LBT05_14735 [Planctomycetaceae bacterium]|nr:hypothetical protein [Planctomycetaceae bacterium]
MDAVNPIWMKYQVTTTCTPDHSKWLAKNSNDIINKENVTYDNLMEWAQKGDKLRFSSIAPRLYNGKIVAQAKEDRWVFDGKMVVNNPSSFYLNDKEHPLYKISSDKKYAQVYETPFAISGDIVLYRILNEDNLKIQFGNTEVLNDGSKIIHLNIENPKYSEKIDVLLTDNPYYKIQKL